MILLKLRMEHITHVEGLHDIIEQSGNKRFSVAAFQIAVSVVFAILVTPLPR